MVRVPANPSDENDREELKFKYDNIPATAVALWDDNGPGLVAVGARDGHIALVDPQGQADPLIFEAHGNIVSTMHSGLGQL